MIGIETRKQLGANEKTLENLERYPHGHRVGTHKGCGGEVIWDWNMVYEDEDGTSVPSLSCAACGHEIGGDHELETVPELDEQYEEV